MQSRILSLVAIHLTLSAPAIVAQSIETLPLERTTLCASDSITVRFRAMGESWQTFNEFVLEVSLPDGTFGSGTRKIGRISSVSPDEVEQIGAMVPDDLDLEGRYRFRVSATRPAVAGTDNGQDIRIVPQAIAEFGLPGGLLGFIGVTGPAMQITSYVSGATRVEWDFGEGAVPATSNQVNPPPIRYQTPGLKKISLTAFNEAGCPRTRSIGFDVFENHPRIPANTSIRKTLDDDTLDNPTLTNHLWVCPDDTLTFNHNLSLTGRLTVYVESGATVRLGRSGVNVVVYLKRGGSLIVREPRSNGLWIIYEVGALLDIDEPIGLWHVRVDSIIFDYSEAPEDGCRLGSSSVGIDRTLDVGGSLVHVDISSGGNAIEGRVTESGARITDVVLYGIRGEQVLSGSVDAERFTIRLGDLPPGLYLVVINTTAGIVHRRVILPR
jgi:hypothetical protein